MDDPEDASWLAPNMAFGSFRMRVDFGISDRVPEAELDAHLLRVGGDFTTLFDARRK